MLVAPVDDAGGHHIILHEQALDALEDQLGTILVARGLLPVADAHQGGVVDHPAVHQCPDKAVGPAQHVHRVGRAGDHAHTLGHTGKQRLGGFVGGFLVIVDDAGHIAVRAGAVGADEGDIGIVHQRGDGVAVAAHINNTRHLLGHQIVHRRVHQLDALRVVRDGVAVTLVEAQIAENIMIVLLVADRSDAVHDLRGVEDGQILSDDADGPGVPQLQRAGVEVRPVVQRGGDLQDHVCGFLLDAGFIVQDFGDGGDGDACNGRDLPYGGHDASSVSLLITAPGKSAD